jgi:hypothetical protein
LYRQAFARLSQYDFRIECPTGSGQSTNLNGAAHELAEPPGSLFVPLECQPLPCHSSFARYADDLHRRDHTLFYRYFDGDAGRGLAAKHQTSWSVLITCPLEDCYRSRGARAEISRRNG